MVLSELVIDHGQSVQQKCPILGNKNLEDGNGEGGSFSGSGLGLSDHVPSLDDRLDCSLLDGGWLFKSVSIDAPATNCKVTS